jgi:hypothetical protein
VLSLPTVRGFQDMGLMVKKTQDFILSLDYGARNHEFRKAEAGKIDGKSTERKLKEMKDGS